MSGTHAILAYSKADRWTRCTGSIALCKDIEDKPNEAAALGTAKHEVAYWCMMHTNPDKTADSELGHPWSHDGFAGNFTEEDIEHVNTCLSLVRAIPGSLRLFELPLRKTEYLHLIDPDVQGGTADVVIGNREQRILHVGDYKFGYGAVDAEYNRQMMGYGRSALEELDEFGVYYDEVHLHVFQPKRSQETLTCKLSVQDLRAHTDAWAAPAQEAMDAWYGRGQPKLTPGDKQCAWCPVRASCSARAAQILDAFPLEEAGGTGAEKPRLTDEAIAAALDRVDAIESWCRYVRAEALQRATGGAAIPGYKLIEGKRGNRKWVDASVAQVTLEELGIDPFEAPELVSPTEAEKRLKKAAKPYTEVAMIVEQSAGAPSLAKWAEAGTPVPTVEFGLDPAQ